MVGACVAGLILAVAALVAGRGGVRRAAAGPAARRRGLTAVELNAFEVRDDQIDRFEHCPPAGEIGQDWVPPIPEWHPPAASASAAVPESAVDASGGDGDAGRRRRDGEDPMAPAPARRR